MNKYWIVLTLSISYAIVVSTFIPKSPYPAGVYTGTRYRISSEEPDAQLSTKIEITPQSQVIQKITLKDDSIDSFAAFRFSGEIDNCEGFRCEYSRKGMILLKTDIHKPIFESKYLELLSKSKGAQNSVSQVDLLLKENLFIIVYDVNDAHPYMYARNKKTSL